MISPEARRRLADVRPVVEAIMGLVREQRDLQEDLRSKLADDGEDSGDLREEILEKDTELRERIRDLNRLGAIIKDPYAGLIDFYTRADEQALAAYSEKALRRIWKAERFSWWMTMLLHRFPDDSSFDRRIQRTDMEYLFSSTAAQTSLAENYVGLPF